MSQNQLDKKSVAWSALFSEPMSELVQRYTASVGFDRRLWRADIAGSLAHAEMLAAQGIIDPARIHTVAGAEIPSGILVVDGGVIAQVRHIEPDVDIEGHRDVYGKVVHAFQNPLLVMLYIAGQLGLGLHVSHAVSSSLQKLGFEHAAFNRLFKAAGPTVALLIMLGNTAIILAVYLGIVRA